MKTRKNINIIVTIAIILTTFGAWYLGLLPVHAIEMQGSASEMLSRGDKVYFGLYQQQEITDLTGLTLNVDYITALAEIGNNNFSEQHFLIEPIEWRVLQNTGDELFLLSEKILISGVPYHEEDIYVTWEDCTLRSWLNGNNDEPDNFFHTAFSAKERTKISTTLLKTSSILSLKEFHGFFTNDKIFLLSLEEMQEPSFGFSSSRFSNDLNRVALNTHYTARVDYWRSAEEPNFWRLRTVYFGSRTGMLVNTLGSIEVYKGGYLRNGSYGIRPAFNLNLNSVLFTSAASGENCKSTATIGSGLIDVSAPTDAVKLTIIDDTLTLACIDNETRTVKTGDTITLNYWNVSTGRNRYVSCVIENSDSVLFYAKLKDCETTNANGMVSFTVPPLADGNYTIKLFSEEVYGDYKTDFCSMPIIIPMTVDNTASTEGAPKTGDRTGTFPLLWMAILSAFGIAIIIPIKRRME